MRKRGFILSSFLLILTGVSILIIGGPVRVLALPPDTPNPNTWVTNNPVYAIASAGKITYIGGSFTRVAPYTGHGACLSASTGQPIPPFSRVDGNIYCVSPDGYGGWYIGGSFTKVGSVGRNNIAHVLGDGSLDPSWNPNANGTVMALAVNGETVYAGGWFTSIGGQERNRIAALDASTGAVTPWNPNANNDCIYALAVSGGTVYAGGRFTYIGGQPRNYIAALDVSTGAATSWNPYAAFAVRTIAVSDGTVYAGGEFRSIGGQDRNYIAALDASTGAATSWNPNANGTVMALAVNGETLYAGGYFTSIGGQERNQIAALDASTAAATSWNPNADGGSVLALAVGDGVVYAGGSFETIGGETRICIAAIDAASGYVTLWNPYAQGAVLALAANGGVVYAGGRFTSIGGQTRNFVAAVNATTGELTSWNPNPNPTVSGLVTGLAVQGGVVYIWGDFTEIGGQARNYIAALDAVTGAVNSWKPNPDNGVEALVVSGETVYVGGYFTSIGGEARNYIAALNASTGAAIPWNPNANYWVMALAMSGETVYVGGDFTSIGGQARNYIAALDASTGTVTPWNPNSNCCVDTLVVENGVVYAGGTFTTLGGQTRTAIGAIDAATGLVTPWNPNAGETHSYVATVAWSGETIYVGGGFNSIGGQARNYIAALDASTGTVTPWNPNADNYVYALAVNGETVYVGGIFRSIRGEFQPYLAQFGANPSITSTPDMLEFGRLDIGQTSVPKVLTITNVGESDLVIDSILITGPNLEDFILQSDLCSGKTLVPSGNCLMEVSFSPESTGLKWAYVTVSSNTPEVWALDVPLTGIAGIPNISVTPSSVDFGNVPLGSSTTSTVTISNLGTANLTVGTLTLKGAGASEFSLQNDACSGHSVVPSSSCSVKVLFSPLSVGSKSATLSIPSNDPDTPTFNAALSGVGTVLPPEAAALISPSGTITTTNPTYTWNAVSTATDYYLWVDDSTGTKIQQWYTASACGCTSGTGTCSVTPAIALVVGSCSWRIQTKNSAGTGPWSNEMPFTVLIFPPSAATLISPSGTIMTTNPTYTWNALSNSTWYCLYVNDSTGNKINQWYTRKEAGCAWGTGTCSVTPTTEVIGSCQWWIGTYNSVGFGPWSSPMSFMTPTTPPPAATLVSPSGTIIDTTPTYTWNAVSSATWYHLWVNDSTGNRVNQWYTATQAGCGSGIGTCSVTPTMEVRGAGIWYVRTYNGAGFGPWSLPGMWFTAPTPVAPSAATQVSPSGTITDTTPTYTWSAVSYATWYCLYVNDSTGNRINNQWYAAADAHCADYVDGVPPTCSVTPTMEVRGAGQWWIRSYNSGGYGPWSLPGMLFTAPTPLASSAATQVSPTGTINDVRPTYTWNPVASATWYQLWVGDSGSNKINQWYAAADAGCADGVGTCSVTPSTMVLGPMIWYIRTYNSEGYGPWSLPGMSFTVSP